MKMSDRKTYAFWTAYEKGYDVAEHKAGGYILLAGFIGWASGIVGVLFGFLFGA